MCTSKFAQKRWTCQLLGVAVWLFSVPMSQGIYYDPMGKIWGGVEVRTGSCCGYVINSSCCVQIPAALSTAVDVSVYISKLVRLKNHWLKWGRNISNGG
jgi:hypothetical protein